MGVCETNSLEASGPSRPRRRQGHSSSRAPPGTRLISTTCASTKRPNSGTWQARPHGC